MIITSISSWLSCCLLLSCGGGGGGASSSSSSSSAFAFHFHPPVVPAVSSSTTRARARAAAITTTTVTTAGACVLGGGATGSAAASSSSSSLFSWREGDDDGDRGGAGTGTGGYSNSNFDDDYDDEMKMRRGYGGARRNDIGGPRGYVDPPVDPSVLYGASDYINNYYQDTDDYRPLPPPPPPPPITQPPLRSSSRRQPLRPLSPSSPSSLLAAKRSSSSSWNADAQRDYRASKFRRDGSWPQRQSYGNSGPYYRGGGSGVAAMGGGGGGGRGRYDSLPSSPQSRSSRSFGRVGGTIDVPTRGLVDSGMDYGGGGKYDDDDDFNNVRGGGGNAPLTQQGGRTEDFRSGAAQGEGMRGTQQPVPRQRGGESLVNGDGGLSGLSQSPLFSRSPPYSPYGRGGGNYYGNQRRGRDPYSSYSHDARDDHRNDEGDYDANMFEGEPSEFEQQQPPRRQQLTNRAKRRRGWGEWGDDAPPPSASSVPDRGRRIGSFGDKEVQFDGYEDGPGGSSFTGSRGYGYRPPAPPASRTPPPPPPPPPPEQLAQQRFDDEIDYGTQQRGIDDRRGDDGITPSSTPQYSYESDREPSRPRPYGPPPSEYDRDRSGDPPSRDPRSFGLGGLGRMMDSFMTGPAFGGGGGGGGGGGLFGRMDRMMGRVESELSESMARDRRSTRALLADARDCLLSDPAVRNLVGESREDIVLGKPYSQSSSKTMVNGVTRSRLQLIIPISGSVATGRVRLVADQDGITLLEVEVGGRVVKVPLDNGRRRMDDAMDADVVDRETYY